MSNKKSGTDFENEFRKLAYDNGFFATPLVANERGQPADVLMSKNNVAVLVDCKDCANNKFSLSRIEENQYYAMKTWHDTGNTWAVFALKADHDIYIIPYKVLISLRDNGHKQLNLAQIQSCGKCFNNWVVDFDANIAQ